MHLQPVLQRFRQLHLHDLHRNSMYMSVWSINGPEMCLYLLLITDIINQIKYGTNGILNLKINY